MWYMDDDEPEFEFSDELKRMIREEDDIFCIKGPYSPSKRPSREERVAYMERREREILSDFFLNYREWPVCCGLPTISDVKIVDDNMVIEMRCKHCQEYVKNETMKANKGESNEDLWK